MKIYTRVGDDGRTSLLGPGRVFKDDARVEAYGTVDELNAHLGVVRAADLQGWFASELDAIQAELFQVGAELATTAPDLLARLDRVDDLAIGRLETLIDRFDLGLAPLTTFILPGGCPLATQLHLARTVCRRAERRVVALLESGPAGAHLVRYLNRLGDLLFVLARAANLRAGVAETPWIARRGDAG